MGHVIPPVEPPIPPPTPPPEPPYPPPEPPQPPPPPNPPPECSYVYTFIRDGPGGFAPPNPCLDPGCMSICTDFFGAILVFSDPSCSSCPFAWYLLSDCTCEFFEYWFYATTCTYTFFGCSDSADVPPSPVPQNYREAFILAHTYNFSPLELGKFEPDKSPFSGLRTMILANFHDKTNVLIAYHPSEL